MMDFECLESALALGTLIDCELREDSLYCGLAVFYPGCPEELDFLELDPAIYKPVCKLYLPTTITEARTTVVLSSPEPRKIKFRCLIY